MACKGGKKKGGKKGKGGKQLWHVKVDVKAERKKAEKRVKVVSNYGKIYRRTN